MRSTWLADAAPTFFAILAEGAWLTIVYLAIGLAFGTDAAPLSLASLALAVAVGVLLGRLIEDRASRGIVLVVAVAVAASVGILAHEAARSALGSGISKVVGAHPGGAIVGLAIVRGYAHRGAGDQEASMDRLLRWGVLLLIVPWLLGTSLGGDGFVTEAFAATVIFVGAGLVALAGARLRSLGDAAGVDWRAGRAWLGTVGVVLAGMVVLIVPSAIVLGDPAAVAMREIVGPVAIMLWAIPVGLGAVVGVFIAPLFGILGPLLEAIRVNLLQQAPTPAAPPDVQTPGAVDADWLLGLVALAVLLVAIWLARRIVGARRRAALIPQERGDQRSFVLPTGFRLPRLQRRQGRRILPTPHDAVSAYLRVLADLEDDPHAARLPNETPADHAARLRRQGTSGLALDLLAADYQLVRFACVELTSRERLRAIERWRHIKAAREPAS